MFLSPSGSDNASGSSGDGSSSSGASSGDDSGSGSGGSSSSGGGSSSGSSGGGGGGGSHGTRGAAAHSGAALGLVAVAVGGLGPLLALVALVACRRGRRRAPSPALLDLDRRLTLGAGPVDKRRRDECPDDASTAAESVAGSLSVATGGFLADASS